MTPVTDPHTDLDILILQPALPPYRREFLTALCDRFPKLRVLSGSSRADPTVEVGVLDFDFVDLARNYFLLRRSILIQRPMRPVVQHPGIVFLDLNPRNVSTWFALLLRRATGRRSVVWGHQQGRRGSSLGAILRQSQMKLADAIVVYTESERDRLRGFPPVFAAGNGVYSARDMKALPIDLESPLVFIYSGRLVEEKEVGLLLESFRLYLDMTTPENCSAKLLLLGGGPDRPRLEELVETYNLGERVEFLGAVWDRSEIAAAYRRSSVAVCAGYVGLNCIQAHSFGRPMIWRERSLVEHAPEVESLSADNGICVPLVSLQAIGIAQAMLEFESSRAQWFGRSSAMVERTADHYSVESMVSSFEAAVSAAVRSKY